MSKDQPKMMDPSMPEAGQGQMYVNRPRNTYGMDTLIAEVDELFAVNNTYEVSHRNQRGVAFDVQFDTTLFPEDERQRFATLLTLIEEDPRVEEVIVDEDTGVLVSFVNNPVIMDGREPFGLADAWIILNGDES